MSLEAVADELESVCERAAECRMALLSAVDGVQRAREWLERVSAGSSDPEWAELLGCLAEVERGIDEVSLALSDGVGLVLDVVADLIGGGDHRTADEPAAPPDSWSWEVLPPPVVPGTRQRTHGLWDAADGVVRPIVSGQDDKSDLAAALFAQLGLKHGTPGIIHHVETKLAAHMRKWGIRSATVTINNVPCEGGRFTCDSVLPVLLPAGSELTVHGVNGFRKTYRGGSAAPWRKR
ncbi:hypothetical protein APASM_5925 [Actinosynnema pretiosum subsp. pretiosum]|nr:hypothetical protein APASM_5925 [Actinosynnema pretiosum subsp. pretiosum]